MIRAEDRPSFAEAWQYCRLAHRHRLFRLCPAFKSLCDGTRKQLVERHRGVLEEARRAAVSWRCSRVSRRDAACFDRREPEKGTKRAEMIEKLHRRLHEDVMSSQ